MAIDQTQRMIGLARQIAEMPDGDAVADATALAIYRRVLREREANYPDGICNASDAGTACLEAFVRYKTSEEFQDDFFKNDRGYARDEMTVAIMCGNLLEKSPHFRRSDFKELNKLESRLLDRAAMIWREAGAVIKDARNGVTSEHEVYAQSLFCGSVFVLTNLREKFTDVGVAEKYDNYRYIAKTASAVSEILPVALAFRSATEIGHQIGHELFLLRNRIQRQNKVFAALENTQNPAP